MVKSVPLVKLPSPAMDRERIIAAIDMGTNSLHMVVVRINPTLPAFTIIDREKDTVRLGERDSATGKLKSEVMARAIATMRRFQEIAKSLKAEEIIAVATSAVRESSNGRAFLQQVADELGIQVDLISGPEEARRIYLGVLSGMEFNKEPHIIIDIGGGSTELILGNGDEPLALTSTKVGAVRLTEDFVTTDPISDEEFQYLQAYIRGMLERAVDELRSQLPPGESPHLVGTSGTIETLAMIDAQERLGEVPSPLTGYELSFQNLKELLDRLRKLSYQERLQITGMPDRRAEILLAGALIIQEAMTMLGMKSVTICERALREGIIVNWMLAHGLIEDKLRYQSAVRERSVLKIAHKYQANLDSSEIIACFALRLFDQTQGILHQWGSEERELLWAAAILHNCGVYISHSSHHKHSYYLIRHAEFLGFTETDIEIIANLARYHRKSQPKKKHDNYANLPSKEHRQMVRELSALLRLAVALDRRQIGAIADIQCDYSSKSRVLHLKLRPTDITDDCSLELWSLERKKEVFEEEYAVELVPALEQVVPVAG
ncbi:MAG: Ppx/GppA family phosphatase [Oscillatoria sp. SIO1A7]|nr:Ppx/GppA family phosphatase [Oscillatoria sp. SIO1A7]